MNDASLGLTLAWVFGVLAASMGILGVFSSPVALGVAVPFGVSAAVLWYHGSGRLEARLRRSARRRTGRDASAGPRGPNFGDSGRMRGDPRGARGRRGAAGGRARGDAGSRADGDADGARGRYAPRGERAGPTREEALSVLGLDADASSAEVRAAYRERAKDLHPDRGGDEEAFKRLNRAYDRLRE